jgi:hypothetical protein
MEDEFGQQFCRKLEKSEIAKILNIIKILFKNTFDIHFAYFIITKYLNLNTIVDLK